jgi:hypothetical protein
MQVLYTTYNQILAYFPSQIHGLISLILAVLLIYAIFKVLESEFIFIILVVVLLPASIPIFNNLWVSFTNFVLYLLAHH